jgi:hypothetical protein
MGKTPNKQRGASPAKEREDMMSRIQSVCLFGGALVGGAFLLPFVGPTHADAVCQPWDCPHTVGPEAGYKKDPHQGGDRDYRDDKSWADTPDKSHDRPSKDGLDDKKDRNKSRIRE